MVSLQVSLSYFRAKTANIQQGQVSYYGPFIMIVRHCLHSKHLFVWWSLVQFNCSVSTSLQSHGLQHARLPCPSATPGVCSNSCSLNWWCSPTISSSVVPFSFLQSFPAIRVFSKESVLCIRWPKYWSFSFSTSPSNEYSWLISFRIGWFDLLAV